MRAPEDAEPMCPFWPPHRYTEESARYKLQRHRQRGDTNVRMVSHDDHWHVVPPWHQALSEPCWCGEQHSPVEAFDLNGKP